MGANTRTTTRRDFIRRSASGMMIGSILPSVSSASPTWGRPVQDDGKVIVFQGDSITDAGRSKDEQRPNVAHGLGNGYAGIAAAQLLGENPSASWEVYNRGVSGHKVFQLAERWQDDAIDLRPDVLSILIGVNDFWHTLTHDYDGTVNVYERDFRALLDQTRAALPDVRLMIGQPFVVEGGSAIDGRWESFGAYRAVAERVAADVNAAWIPYQQIFDRALEEAPAPYWAPDGVHPSPAGNYLMARAWLDAVETI